MNTTQTRTNEQAECWRRMVAHVPECYDRDSWLVPDRRDTTLKDR
jgi:hypothetical protein